MNNSKNLKEYFGIPDQKKVSFVNASCLNDIQCFIDPVLLRDLHLKNFDSKKAQKKIDSFFNTVLTLYKNGSKYEAAKLFTQFSENSSLGLGYARDSKKGRGLSERMLLTFFNEVNKLTELSEKTLTDPAIYRLYIQDFDKDRFTDLITTIIAKELVDYTRLEAADLNIPLTYKISEGYYWDGHMFQNLTGTLPSVNNNSLIFVPYELLTKHFGYTVKSFLRYMVFPKKQAQYTDDNPGKTITIKQLFTNVSAQYASNGGLKQYALDELEYSQNLLPQFLTFIQRDGSSSHSIPLSSEDDVA